MKPISILMIIALLSACNSSPKTEQLVVTNNNGHKESLAAELSVEDIQAIEKEASKGPWMSYNAILADGVKKTYLLDLDSSKSYKFELTSDDDKAKLGLMQQVIDKETKKANFVPMSVTDFEKEVKITKTGPYKAIISLKQRLGEDSTANFTFKVYKNAN